MNRQQKLLFMLLTLNLIQASLFNVLFMPETGFEFVISCMGVFSGILIIPLIVLGLSQIVKNYRNQQLRLKVFNLATIPVTILFFCSFWAQDDVAQASVKVEFLLEAQGKVDQPTRKFVSDQRAYMMINKNVLPHSMILRATYQKNKNDEYYSINLVLNEQGTKNFSQFSKDHIGRRIYVVVNNHIVGAPILMEQVKTGRLTVNGRIKLTMAKNICRSLNNR